MKNSVLVYTKRIYTYSLDSHFSTERKRLEEIYLQLSHLISDCGRYCQGNNCELLENLYLYWVSNNIDTYNQLRYLYYSMYNRIEKLPEINIGTTESKGVNGSKIWLPLTL